MSMPSSGNRLIKAHSAHANFIPTSLNSLIDRDYKEYQKEQERKAKEETEKKAKDAADAEKSDDDSDGKTTGDESRDVDEDGVETITTTTTTTIVQTVKKVKKPNTDVVSSKTGGPGKPKGNESGAPSQFDTRLLNLPDHMYQQEQEWTYAPGNSDSTPDPTKYVIMRAEEDDIYLGLRVYTHKDVPAVVVGRLKAQAEKKDNKEGKEDEEDKKEDGEDKEKGDAKQSLSSLVDSLEDTCDCDECQGRTAHPDHN
jgi:hypothetical protein